MGKRIEQNFQTRFGDRIEFVYAVKPLEAEERRLNRRYLIESVKAIMAVALKREPTQEELLGIVPIQPRRKRGAV